MIKGFASWQGDKDRYNSGHANQYEKNLVHLINTLRDQFKSPDAKFVIGTLGQTRKDTSDTNERLILEAQLAVDGESNKYP